jgi:hypothetical protein
MIEITLKGLLEVISSQKVITINLFNENNLLLITFGLSGYDCLDDFLLDDKVTKIEIVNVNTINVVIDTSQNN